MAAIGRYLRGIFGLQALILGVSIPLLLYRASQILNSPAPFLSESTQLHLKGGLIILLAIELFAGTVLGMAWWTLTKGKRSARGWAIAASIINLPLIGIGTAVGIAGLITFSSGRITQEMEAPVQRPPRLPGDGTGRWSDAAVTTFTTVVLVAAEIGWVRWGTAHGLSTSGVVSLLIQLEIAALFATAIHEGGHMLLGWVSGMQLRFLSVGPFHWRLRSGKWTFRFQQKQLLTGGGATGMAPTKVRNLPSQNVLMMAGGPLASLVLAGLATVVTLTAKGSPWEPMWEFWSLVATLAFLGFAANLIPKATLREDGGGYSDGAQIYQIVSGGVWADVHLALSIVAASLTTPLRPKDYDIRRLERAASFLTQGRKAVLLRLLAHTHYLDSGRLPEALQALEEAERAYAVSASEVSAELHSTFVFANALLRRDAAAAGLWWERMQNKGIKLFDVDYFRALAALRWVQNQASEAREAWEKGSQIAQNLPRAGAYEFDRWCYAQLRTAMDRTEPPPVPAPELIAAVS